MHMFQLSGQDADDSREQRHHNCAKVSAVAVLIHRVVIISLFRSKEEWGTGDENDTSDHEDGDARAVGAKVLVQHAHGKDKGEDWSAKKDGRSIAQGHVLDGHEDAQEQYSTQSSLHKDSAPVGHWAHQVSFGEEKKSNHDQGLSNGTIK